MPATDKHSSLFFLGVNVKAKMFYEIGPGWKMFLIQPLLKS
jgi:hypothetical protein